MKKPRSAFISQKPHWVPFIVIAFVWLFISGVSLACNAPEENGPAATAEPGSNQAIRETQVADNLQATQAALDSGQPVAQTQTALDATQVALEAQATLNAQAATEAAQPTEPPPPTNTVEPPVTEPTTEPPTSEPPPPEDQAADLDTLIQDSKILLFENVTKIPLPRYIKQALDNLGLSRNYVDTKDAPGNFKAQLLSGTDWDLIVVGVEARSSIEGEFFDYFNEQVNKGTGLVLEIWDLDEIAGAKATSFLSNCGVQVQSDWYDPPLTARSIWWLYGESPIFHEPNEGMSLVNYNPYWAGDAGDLLRISPGSDAVMLAGTYAQEKSSYGVLAACHDDRVIIQTYSSHDYRQDDVVRLWENFIYNALRAHFEYENR